MEAQKPRSTSAPKKYKHILQELHSAMKYKEKEMPVALRIMQLFGLSKAVAYKKLRGDILFSVEELFRLADYYGIRLSELQSADWQMAETMPSDKIMVLPLVTSFRALRDNFKQIMLNISLLRNMQNFELVYVARDLPLFHNFKFRELGAFKSLVWINESHQKKYKLHQVPRATLDAGKELYDFYTELHITEIWSPQVLQNTLNHVRYYHQLNIIDTAEALVILDQIHQVVAGIKAQNLDRKNPQTGSTILATPFIMMANSALINYGKNEKYALIAASAIQSLAITDRELINAIETSVDFHKVHCTNLSDSSVLVVEEFFKLLFDEIERYRMLIAEPE